MFKGLNSNYSALSDFTLIFVSIFTISFFFITHEGLYALDDYFYSRYAYQLANGTFRLEPDPLGLLTDPLKERPLIFGPVALLYTLFGIDIITTTLWPLLCTIGCFVIIWALYRRQEPVVAAGAIIFLGLHYFTLDLTRYLYADNILMFWCLASASALLWVRRHNSKQVAWGMGFALLNFAAMLSKETILYYIPFYLGLLVVDIWQRKRWQFWFAAIASGIILILLYLGFYYYYTGDPFYRIHLIENTNDYLKENNYLMGKRSALAARLTYLPLIFLIGIGLGAMIVLALIAFFSKNPKRSEVNYWFFLGFSALAIFWLGSTSLSQYNPITLLPRMTTPFLPPLALAAGFGLLSFVRSANYGWFIGAALLGCAIWLHNSLSVMYGGMALFFMSAAFFKQTQATYFLSFLKPGSFGFLSLTLTIIGFCLLSRPLYIMQKPTVSSHFDQAFIINKHLKSKAKGVVFTDDYLIGNYDFYFGYEVPKRLTFQRYWARDSVLQVPGQKAWLLLNRSTLTNDELTRKLIRYSADSVLPWYPHRRLVAESGKVTLYEVLLNK